MAGGLAVIAGGPKASDLLAVGRAPQLNELGLPVVRLIQLPTGGGVLDWKDHLAFYLPRLKDEGINPEEVTISVIQNGKPLHEGLPLATNSVFVKAHKDQMDYFVELRTKGRLLHRSNVVIKERFDSQNVMAESFVDFLANRALKFETPKFVRERGYDGKLSDIAFDLGYKKISWVLKRDADESLKRLMADQAGEIDVRVKLNAEDEPESATLIERSSGKVLREVPAGQFYFKLDAAFSGNSFFWDDMFVSLATVSSHPWLVRSTIRFWLDVQKANDGVIPREVRKSNLESLWFQDVAELGAGRGANLQYTNPYLMNWVAEELYKYDPSRENVDLLREVAASIEQYGDWMMKNRSVYTKDGTWMGFTWNALGSGLDNSRGGRGNFYRQEDYQSAWVDSLAQQISMTKTLAVWYTRFANDPSFQKDGYSLKARQAEARAKMLEEHLNKYYWNEEEAFYFDLIPDGKGGLKQDTRYFSIAGFWPLYSASLSPEQTAKFVAKHFTPERFGGDFPLPVNSRHVIDKSDPDEDGYWDKQTHWPPMGTVAIEGLARLGQQKLATDLTLRYLAGMQQANATTVAEFYGEVVGADGKIRARIGQHKPHKTRLDFAGWGKVPPLYLLLKHVYGIDPQADGTLRWSILIPLEIGESLVVRNIELHGKKMTLSLKRESDTAYVVSSSDSAPLKVELRLSESPASSTFTVTADSPARASLK